jgi:hypothetical protein
MILGVLFAFAAGLEAFLMFGKEYLLDESKLVEMEQSLQQAYADLREAKTRHDTKRADLKTAIDDRERQTKLIREEDKRFTASLKLLPTLIHTIGQPYDGQRFRAKISKELPHVPDKNQKLIWDCPNLVEVWSTDLGSAQAAVAKQFPAKQGYTVEDLELVQTKSPEPNQPADVPPVTSTAEAAA